MSKHENYTKRAPVEPTKCGDCGMEVMPNEYHPFAACLMFRGCHNSVMVRENLKAMLAAAPPDDELALLKDPENVHLAMLRGHIAKISRDQWLHLEGDAAQELARLEREIATETALSMGRIVYPNGIAEWGYPDVASWGEKYMRYLELRGLLERHPDKPNLVRIKERA